ncbi:uncharacterized protein RCC_11427 [Ramularia collo-cygni]|uniref:Uncharacterized protein n=1 Tax=Ramularia collo-cygni TaxID=112498 RepID=A0A2D3VC53_9PEZI|nr:uncharacterized protein RCC_11427 [Ramularia collo-cygni]CZT25758.1 uncharacterized protein RCC_11427 [Ramularia collo-cygni]
MSESTSAEALFRANKRRKIYRKRNVDDEDNEDPPEMRETKDPESPAQEETQTVKRPATRKYGIGFSTAGNKAVPEEGTIAQTAMVPFQSEDDDSSAAHDRFIKPAGKAAVVEDKHLTAYVDSKLAELRYSASTPNANQTESVSVNSFKHIATQGDIGADGEQTSTSNALTGQQPGQRNAQRVRPTKQRRGPPQRDAHDIARDAMVDQIMRESQVPIYEQSNSKANEVQPGDFDADAAAEEAFRAEFLRSLEEQQNRRRPAAPPVQQRGAPPVPTGPKLGGSRAQREKMKAIEEAKAAGKSVDAVPKRR